VKVVFCAVTGVATVGWVWPVAREVMPSTVPAVVMSAVFPVVVGVAAEWVRYRLARGEQP
jgi:hypothetical protein